MKILLNGDERDVEDAQTVIELLESAGFRGRRVAIEINREIVPRSEHAVRRLQPGDRVEIVHAIGGG